MAHLVPTSLASVIVCLFIACPSHNASAAFIEVLGQGFGGPPDTGYYRLHNGLSVEDGTMENGEIVKATQGAPIVNLAKGMLKLDPNRLRFSAWVLAGSAGVQIDTSFRIMPEAGEQEGDQVSMFMHVMPAYNTSNILVDSWHVQSRVGFTVNPVAFDSQLDNNVDDPPRVPQPVSVPFTAEIGSNYLVYFTASGSGGGGVLALDVAFEISFSQTPPPQPPLVPEPSTLTLASLGLVGLLAFGRRG